MWLPALFDGSESQAGFSQAGSIQQVHTNFRRNECRGNYSSKLRRHGVYSPRAPCQFDEPCGVTAPHGFFESAPNHDAIALRVVDDDLSQSMYTSMTSIEGLRPCGWTIPNFPDYDDSCNGCMGWGTWVSGGSWSTAEGRAILAHFRGGRLDLAAASMGRLIDPCVDLATYCVACIAGCVQAFDCSVSSQTLLLLR